MRVFAVLLAGLLFPSALLAGQNLVMVRSAAPAQRVMDVLKETVPEYGYKVAHIQRCDGGMAEFHYKSDFYRVVFFGKAAEVRAILKKHPEMSAYLPLKIAVIAENEQTVIAALDPRVFKPLFPGDPALSIQFDRWYNDIHSMLEELHHLKKP